MGQFQSKTAPHGLNPASGVMATDTNNKPKPLRPSYSQPILNGLLGADTVSLGATSQWSSASTDFIHITITPPNAKADFPFLPVMTKRECTAILSTAPVYSYLLFSDTQGGGNLAVRLHERLQRLHLARSSDGAIALEIPHVAEAQPRFQRLIDLILYYSTDRPGLKFRLALPLFDFSSLRDGIEQHDPTARPASHRNISTIQEGHTSSFSTGQQPQPPPRRSTSLGLTPHHKHPTPAHSPMTSTAASSWATANTTDAAGARGEEDDDDLLSSNAALFDNSLHSTRPDAASPAPAAGGLNDADDDLAGFGFYPDEPSPDNQEVAAAVVPVIPDCRGGRPALAPGLDGDDPARLVYDSLVAKRRPLIKPLTDDEPAVPMNINFTAQLNFHDHFAWWRAKDCASSSFEADPWCHGPHLSAAHARSLLSTFGKSKGNCFLLRQLVQWTRSAEVTDLRTHEFLIRAQDRTFALGLIWRGHHYQFDMGSVMAAEWPGFADMRPTVKSLHQAYQALAQYACEQDFDLGCPINVPILPGVGRSAAPLWLHENISEGQAATLLAGTAPGTFVVRALPRDRQFALTVSADNAIHVYHLAMADDLSWMIEDIPIDGAVSLVSTVAILNAAVVHFPDHLDAFIPCSPDFEAGEAPPLPEPMETDSQSSASPTATLTPVSPASTIRPTIKKAGGRFARSQLASERRADLMRFALNEQRVQRTVVIERRRGESWGITLRTVAGELGTMVAGVDPGSPADCGGLKFGDVFLRIDDQVVAHSSHHDIKSSLRAATKATVAVVNIPATHATSSTGTMSSRVTRISSSNP